MKVAVSASGADLEAAVDPRFGRCAYYVVVDTDSMEFEAVENAAAGQSSGAGIAAAQLVSQTGAQAVISGNIGPNAFQALSAGGLEVYTGASGSVRQAVEAFNAGQLQSAGGANVGSRFGTGGAGTGMGGAGMGGGGMGAGAGMGRGMGMGGGMGGGQFAQQMPSQMAPGIGPQWNVPPTMVPEAMRAQQLQVLKTQAQMLQQQLELLGQQIEQLEQQTIEEGEQQ